MSDPLGWIDDEAAAWASRGLERALRTTGSRADAERAAEQAEPALVNFASNDYLGLASDPRVVAAGVRAAEQYGWGAGASALVSGWRVPHQELAQALASFEGTEAVLVFPTGYAANMGTLAALVGRGDAVYSDRLNHACLIDGARLSRAQVRIFAHNDVAALESLLAADRGRFRRRLIATEGVFGMDGELAPLAELVDLAERHEAMLLVDEAHATGVYGPEGRGACEACGVLDRVPIRIGTLSKALGSQGGFVAGSKRLIDWLVNHARPLIYSTALPPAVAAAAHEAVRIVQRETERRAQLWRLAGRLHESLDRHGLALGPMPSPIVPVLAGQPQRALAWAEHLRGLGFWVPAIRPPSVPEGTSRLRISLSTAHREEQVDALAAAIGALASA